MNFHDVRVSYFRNSGVFGSTERREKRFHTAVAYNQRQRWTTCSTGLSRLHIYITSCVRRTRSRPTPRSKRYSHGENITPALPNLDRTKIFKLFVHLYALHLITSKMNLTTSTFEAQQNKLNHWTCYTAHAVVWTQIWASRAFHGQFESRLSSAGTYGGLEFQSCLGPKS